MCVPCLADVNALEDSVLYLQQHYADCSRNSYGWKNMGEYMVLSGRVLIISIKFFLGCPLILIPRDFCFSVSGLMSMEQNSSRTKLISCCHSTINFFLSKLKHSLPVILHGSNCSGINCNILLEKSELCGFFFFFPYSHIHLCTAYLFLFLVQSLQICFSKTFREAVRLLSIRSFKNSILANVSQKHLIQHTE